MQRKKVLVNRYSATPSRVQCAFAIRNLMRIESTPIRKYGSFAFINIFTFWLLCMKVSFVRNTFALPRCADGFLGGVTFTEKKSINFLYEKRASHINLFRTYTRYFANMNVNSFDAASVSCSEAHLWADHVQLIWRQGKLLFSLSKFLSRLEYAKKGHERKYL